MIVTESLAKRYGAVTAVDGLDLKVEPGEIFGFLGPNGAGKTTTIRILTTLTKPTDGRALIDGFDVVRQPHQAKGAFGVVQQHLSLDRELSVWENMELHRKLHHMNQREGKRRITELLEYVELADQSGTIVERLSGGMKRRAMIARALLHSPKVIMLDEPTVGLDAQTRRRLWELIRRLNADGATVFLTTHYIEEAEALCRRVAVINHGSLIALGTPLDLRRHLGLITVETFDNGNARYHFFPDRDAATAFVQGLPPGVVSVVMRESNLEDVFVEMTGRKVGE